MNQLHVCSSMEHKTQNPDMKWECLRSRKQIEHDQNLRCDNEGISILKSQLDKLFDRIVQDFLATIFYR